ncbi:hypothetical protein A6M27_17595 [Acidithiobacillus thiooxidans]|uniref:hypothetical protein n=1 Tax=Acidithiobacillus thiooxidans TaxID=930 RepID=UPI0004633FA4|nr:hypothetical protein [Acidithiobacillus thiooxidans]OCX77670.1 hypothetical protein A6O26_19375 [Acidithiobacillus thiooxidans]OCX78117.1 hypothetical protein A6O24_05285 [Acidithiobacillus thiooxidans]OCX83392.1 hypothetical protein A6M27_17595 [Acidithiobacillus thiooxidans]OFC50211.1 hypothetical protein BAE47_02630 [Acidithiobacillus thiooxidans]
MDKKTKSDTKTSLADQLREGLLEASALQEFILRQPLWLLGTGVAELMIMGILAFSFPIGAVPLGSQIAFVVSILLYIGIMQTEHYRIDTQRMAPRSWLAFAGPLIAMYGLFIYGLVSFLVLYFH